MRIKFWGTRGSIAKPGPATQRYGGNTSCVELRSDAGTLVVLDCGTGSHALGQQLCAQADGPVNGHLLISHTHWDHIQGIPFFAPLFASGGVWHVYGPRGLSSSLRTTLAGQMEHTYFPISIDQLAARIEYHDLVEGQLQIEDITVSCHFLNHPALTLGYRLHADGASVAYCCDHEPYAIAMADGRSPITGPDQRHVEFIAGADLVIHDAQYTAAEYPQKLGWGHSPVEYAVRVCREAGVHQLALTHHDPLREDYAVDQIIANLRTELADQGATLELVAAAEGMTIELGGHRAAPPTAVASVQTDARREIQAAEHTVLLHAQTPDLGQALIDAIAAEGFTCLRCDDEADVLRQIGDTPPASILLEHQPPTCDARKLIGPLRAAMGGQPSVPVVLVSRSKDAGATIEDAATDWLLSPFGEKYARTKIRAWALRSPCRWTTAGRPANEAQRLATLQGLNILDTEAEDRFDKLGRIAASAFSVPVALVSLVDAQRQWFKSCIGLGVRETSRDLAFCAHVVESGQDLIIPDTHLDERFADNPLVQEPPHIRFYAGAPLNLDNGECLGTLCLIDFRPRTLSAGEIELLHELRDLVLREILRKSD